MASKILRKINAKLKLLYQKSRFLIPAFRKLLCNALIQPHFDCGCSSRFPLLKKILKIKLQKAQNKYIYFCLNSPPRSRIDPLHPRKIKYRPDKDRVEQYIVHTVFKFLLILYRDTHEIFKSSL